MNEVEELRNRIKELEEENLKLKKQLNKGSKPGRARMFKDHDIESMKFYRFQGKSYKEIAGIFKCSVGLVHKLINENKTSKNI